MAFAEPVHEIPADNRVALRREIGQYLFGTPGQGDAKTIGLRESFVIWQLNPARLKSASPTFPTRPTKNHHYQVYLDNAPRAYAVVGQNDGRQVVRAVVASDVAGLVDQAITWVDQNDQDNTPVNYVAVPSCQVFAFRLVDNDVVYIISAPTIRNLPENKLLLPSAILSTGEFLKRLKYLFDAIRAKKQPCRKANEQSQTKGLKNDASLTAAMPSTRQ